MLLCRGAKSVVAPSLSYYKLAGSVQAAANRTQDARRALHKSGTISCSGLVDRGADGVGVFHVPEGTLQGACVDLRPAWTACESASGLGPFSWKSKARVASDQLQKSFFCLGDNKLMANALSITPKPNQSHWIKREHLPEVQKVLFSKGPQEGAQKPEPEEKQNKTKALKKVFKEYGAVGVSFHIGISLISLGIFYIFVSSGINMTAVLCKLGFSESVVQSKLAAGTSTFVLAYAVHKLFAPFRISITLVSVPLIVRYLRKTGPFKSSPPRL